MTAGDVARRQAGVLVEWNDDRGFGFILPTAGGPRVFAHVTAFPRGRRPVAGCDVTFTEVRDERNRPQASVVQYLGGRARSSGVSLAIATALLFSVLLLVLLPLGRLPLTLLGASVLFSGAAFLMYGADKSAARRGRWRTPESTLHTIALIGGWPGALVARRVFRHKTVKRPFRTVFWVTVVLNCTALAWFVYAMPVPLP